MSLCRTNWRCTGYGRHLPPWGVCILGGAVLLFNLLSLYLLHTSPSRWMHAHGGVLPRRQVAPPPGGVASGAWDRLGNVLCGPLRFVKDSRSGRQPRALASVPGSGNTWLRHLLQQATGYMTGSMYTDAFLMTAGFPGEGISNGSVLVVKTHDAHPDVRRHFQSAVLLIRHPRDAILAEFNRLHGGHLGHARSKHFQEDWKSYVVEAANHWATFNTEWLHFTGPLHIVRYEDLQHNLNATLSTLLRFLNVSATAQDLECALQHSGHAYRRKKKKMADGLSDSDLFSGESLTVLEESERKFQGALDEYLKTAGVTTDL